MKRSLTVVALIAVLCLVCGTMVRAQTPFNGLAVDQTNMHLLSDAKSRSISPENFTGEKGKAAMSTDGPALHAARDLGQGWKVSPFVVIPGESTFTLAEIEGSGAIQQIWLTPAPLHKTRSMILRFYWDGEETPSVEVPIADFFTCGWQEYSQNNSLMVNVNPDSAFNCYWTMPFHKKAKVTVENLDADQIVIYYQINYALGDVPDNAAYFHAQFRRVNPLKAKDVVTLVDGVKGKGQYVGTYMAWEVRSPGWWGEGEIKFFMDGDKEFPTIAGTGTEDYFCGSYNFDRDGYYREFSTPYAGLVQVLPKETRLVQLLEKNFLTPETKRPEPGSFVGLIPAVKKAYIPGQRFGLYRWHITDPIRFEEDLKVTIQALGWQDGGRYLPLEDDISSVAFWYQTEPHAPFPNLPSREELLIERLQLGPVE